MLKTATQLKRISPVKQIETPAEPIATSPKEVPIKVEPTVAKVPSKLLAMGRGMRPTKPSVTEKGILQSPEKMISVAEKPPPAAAEKIAAVTEELEKLDIKAKSSKSSQVTSENKSAVS